MFDLGLQVGAEVVVGLVDDAQDEKAFVIGAALVVLKLASQAKCRTWSECAYRASTGKEFVVCFDCDKLVIGDTLALNAGFVAVGAGRIFCNQCEVVAAVIGIAYRGNRPDVDLAVVPALDVDCIGLPATLAAPAIDTVLAHNSAGLGELNIRLGVGFERTVVIGDD